MSLCPCGLAHANTSRLAAMFTPTKAGYFWLAIDRARKNAERRSQ